MPRIYLDNAATSWPKPPCVWDAVEDWQRRVGAPYGRGGHDSAIEASTLVERARTSLARLLGESDARRVTFAASGTDALNTALLGVLRAGDHVVTTVAEHNAVLRPLRALADVTRGAPVETTYVGVDPQGYVDPDDVRRALRPSTRLVSIVHASNVTGAVQPVQEIASIARANGSLVLLDVAQSIGRFPVDVGALGADLVAAPTHKSLMSPLGLGFLWVRSGVEQHVRPLRYGGAASGGDSFDQPVDMPHRFEAGSLNVPAIVGLAAALALFDEQGLAPLATRAAQRLERLCDGLADTPGVLLIGPSDPLCRAGVVSFTVDGYDPQEFAALLASVAGVECRAGLHCAPRLHEALGTLSGGGAIRFSPGPWTTIEEIDAAVAAVRRLAASAPV
ncbi:MAG: aminotransferase class V-fold PLP-dependent enzyme [Lacipirellulaceae bacterium]